MQDQQPQLPDHTNLSDAQLAAAYAAEALRLGRLQLGHALVGVARAAERAEGGHTPAGHAEAAAQAAMFGPQTMANVRYLGTTRDEHPRAQSHAPQVCSYLYGEPGDPSATYCHQPIGWSDGGGSARNGWYHLDNTITDHEPVAA